MGPIVQSGPLRKAVSEVHSVVNRIWLATKRVNGAVSTRIERGACGVGLNAVWVSVAAKWIAPVMGGGVLLLIVTLSGGPRRGEATEAATSPVTNVAANLPGRELLAVANSPSGRTATDRLPEGTADGIDFLNSGIKNLHVNADDQTGTLHVLFDYDPGSWIMQYNVPIGQPPIQLLIRLFDQNGQHITHFTTAESFYPSEYDDLLSGVDPTRKGLPRTLLAAIGNHLMYAVNARDLSFVRKAEVGFDGRRGTFSLAREREAKAKVQETREEYARFPKKIVATMGRYVRTFDDPNPESENARNIRQEAGQLLLTAGPSAYPVILRAATGGSGGMGGVSVSTAVAASRLAIQVGKPLIPDLEKFATTGQFPWRHEDQDGIDTAVRKVMASAILARLGHERENNVERIRRTRVEESKLNRFNQILLNTAVGAALMLTGTQNEEGAQILRDVGGTPLGTGAEYIGNQEAYRIKAASQVLRILEVGDDTAP